MNHSINIAAKRSGLTAHVIRIWEKRYSAVAPSRTDSNRRQYSDEEIDRLVLLKQATDAGYKISQLAPLTTENLTDLLAKEGTATSQQSPASSTADRADLDRGHDFIERSITAIKNLEARDLEECLTQAALSLGHQGMICQVVAPLAVEMGALWRQGTITAAHEHFASAIIRVFLTNISKPFAIPDSAPRIVVATPAGQLHELGAIIAAASCASAGWKVTYLGTNLPAAEIAGACIQNQSRAVALSIVFPEDDPDLTHEIERLREFLPNNVNIMAGGRAAPAYQTVLDRIGCTVCSNMADFTKHLDSLRTPNSSH